MEVEAFQECWIEESASFCKEEFYESIQAPKWIDFTLPRPQEPDTDDNVWFCIRAGCDQKHGTLLEQTPNHSYLLKSQASRSVNCISKLPTMEGKSRPKQTAPLSAPSLKGRDKTPGKAKPAGMSASKFRQKRCEENEDPNSPNAGSLNLKMDAMDAEGFSTPKPSSKGDGVSGLEENPSDFSTGKAILAASDVNLTPQNQTIKSTAAFSTPRIKKNLSVKPEPFRSNPALSKGMNNKGRSKAVTPRYLLFQTPIKSVKKTPSKDLTPVTKHCTNHTKRVQFAANDHKYSSPVKASPKKYFSTCKLQPSESPVSRTRNFSSSSRPKGSRSVRDHSPSSHRKVLFPEQSNEKETLLRTNEQKIDLVQGKVGSCVENDTAEHRVKCFSGNSHKEQSCQISERDMSLQEKCQEQEDVDVQICVSEMIKRESQHDILEGGTNNRDRIVHEDGGCNRNELSIKQHQAGNNDQKPTYKEDDGIETNTNETMRQESETEQQYAMQLASLISDEVLTYGVSEINGNKESSESYGAEESITTVPMNVPNRIFVGLQQFFENFPKERENNSQIDSDGKAEIAIIEGGEDDDQSEFDVEADDRNLEGIDNKAVMNSAAEDRGAREVAFIKERFSSELESNLQRDSVGKSEVSFLEVGDNYGRHVLNGEPRDSGLKGEAKVVIGSAAGDSGAREEMELKDRNQEDRGGRDLKNELVVECQGCLTDSAAENRGTGEEPSIRIWFASKSESNLQNDSDGKADKNDGESTLDVKPIDRNLQERANKGIVDSASKSDFNGRNMGVTASTDLKSELAMKPNGRNPEERASNVAMNSAAGNRGAAEENSIIIQLGSAFESDLQIDSNGKTEIEFSEDGQHNDRNPEERESKVVMSSGCENKEGMEKSSIKFQFASEAKSNPQNDFDGKADIAILGDGKNNLEESALDVEPNNHNLEERSNTVVMDSSAENVGARENSTKNRCKDKDIEGKESRALKIDIDIESDNIIKEKAGEVLTYSDAENERTIQGTGIEVQPSEAASATRHVEKKDDFNLKNKQNSEEDEYHAVFYQEHAIRGAKEGKSGEADQLESDSKSQNKILQKDSSSDSGECMQVTTNVAIKYVKEDNRDLMQKTNTAENGGNAGLSRPNTRCIGSQYFDPDMKVAAKVSLKSTTGTEQKQCNEIKDCTVVVDISDSWTSSSKVKSNVWDSPNQSETVQEEHHDGLNCLQLKGCIVHVVPDTTGDEQKEMLSEFVKKDTPSTPSKGKKRSSGEMNSKTNCSNGELCQDQSCRMASFTCQSAPLIKINGVSTRYAVKHKKIKPTLPKPFRLRTAERGERKEAGLNKNTQQFVAEKESSPLREKRPNKARLEDKGEEIKSTLEQPPHNRPAIKMPNFLKPPFKPMRSTKKLTTPQEPNFHRMHWALDHTHASQSQSSSPTHSVQSHAFVSSQQPPQQSQQQTTQKPPITTLTRPPQAPQQATPQQQAVDPNLLSHGDVTKQEERILKNLDSVAEDLISSGIISAIRERGKGGEAIGERST
ncbi:hypothetical protein KI387_022862 [Taxus chinensis]|uniref:Uncharacterized protein n=1 Tax=Taxus chinensis TaxID=29808 RepID=A0AA38G1M4_TAXCH|nr:hypothetical protein KI387_022862 [Taxus chinensis]